MNVAMLAPTATDCGIADYTRELCRALAAMDDIEVDVVPIERPAAIPANADVVHLQYEHGFFLDDDDPAGNVDRFFARLDLPVFVTLHCLPLDDPRWLRWLTAPSFGYHVHSDLHAERLRRLAPHAELWRSPFPVGATGTPSTTAEAIAMRFGIADRRVVGAFGFIKAHKGYDTLIDALGHLPEDVVLLIAGGAQDAEDAATEASLRAQIEGCGVDDRAVITGYLPSGEIGPTLEAMNLVVAPFRTMTGSASVATALAWHRPVLASDLPQFQELQRGFGCVECVPPGDATQLAAAIQRLLDDRAARQELMHGAAAAAGACTFAAVARDCRDAYVALSRDERQGHR